jgi:hypothetical protein
LDATCCQKVRLVCTDINQPTWKPDSGTLVTPVVEIAILEPTPNEIKTGL